jgi:hypothetical protein
VRTAFPESNLPRRKRKRRIFLRQRSNAVIQSPIHVCT